jgi:hypothetical protein
MIEYINRSGKSISLRLKLTDYNIKERNDNIVVTSKVILKPTQENEGYSSIELERSMENKIWEAGKNATIIENGKIIFKLLTHIKSNTQNNISRIYAPKSKNLRSSKVNN